MSGEWDNNWDLVENGLIPDYTATADLLLPGAPVEWIGTLHDGRRWYFRARGNQLGLGLGTTLDEAIDNQRSDHTHPGGEYSASYLSPEDTLAWLRRLLGEVTR